MWQNWGNVLLGLWFIASPWVFGFSANGGALWNSIVAGVLVAILAFLSARKGNQA